MENDSAFPIHRTCYFHNFRHNFMDFFSRFVPLQSIAGHEGWRLKLSGPQIALQHNIVKVSLRCPILSPKFKVHSFLTFVNENEEKSIRFERTEYMENGSWIKGPLLLLSDVLDPNGGWLMNGTLSIDFGIHVEAILSPPENIWKFNFYDTMPNFTKTKEMIQFRQDEKFVFTPKMMLTAKFGAIPYEYPMDIWNITLKSTINIDFAEMCFQIAHGVRLQPKSIKLVEIDAIARCFKLPNVSRYCEQQRVLKHKGLNIDHGKKIRIAISINWIHYLAVLLRGLESKKELKEILIGMNLQKMSGEAMKQCTKFFFRNSIS